MYGKPRRLLLDPSASAAEEARIAEAAREQTLQISRPLLMVAGAVAVLWWPLDWLLYADEPEVLRWFAVWRGAVVLLCGLFLAFGYRIEALRRHHAAVATALGAAIAFVIAACLGEVGPMQRPFFASLYLAPLMSFGFLVPLQTRLLGTSIIAAATFAGFFGLHPAWRESGDFGTALGLMAFSGVLAVSAGHANYLRFRHGQRQAMQLEHHAEALDALSHSLAERVQERTAELRSLAIRMQDLLETERREIAGELHDDLGQQLYGMRMELDLARLGGDDDPRLARLEELVESMQASARSILARLRPRILDDLGLVAALQWLVEDMGRRTSVRLRFETALEHAPVDDAVATAAFRAVQEALTNALRHAQASSVTVRLDREADALTLSVVDDGVGLPPPPARRRSALGLIGMRERAETLGGQLALETPSAGGTCVRLSLPLLADASTSLEGA